MDNNRVKNKYEDGGEWTDEEMAWRGEKERVEECRKKNDKWSAVRIGVLEVAESREHFLYHFVSVSSLSRRGYAARVTSVIVVFLVTVTSLSLMRWDVRRACESRSVKRSRGDRATSGGLRWAS